MQMPLAPASEAAPYGPPVDDEHVFIHGMLNEFEGRLGSDSSFRWEGEGWVGDDLNRLWLKTEGESSKGKVDDGQQQAFYSRPISTYFDLQVGARYDLDSRPGRGWGAIGIEGLAPYFFVVSATAYASDDGHYAAKFEASNEVRLTQRLILEPQIEMNFYSRSDPARQIAAGLSDIDAGLRLRYEFTRKFAPYIGVNWAPHFGRPAGDLRSSGDTADARLLIGVRSWF
jgi:copper resistance protein B